MIHFGRFCFNEDAIDYIELNGDGSYTVYLMRGNKGDYVFREVAIKDEDADALREWIDSDKKWQSNTAAVNEHAARHARECGGEE